MKAKKKPWEYSPQGFSLVFKFWQRPTFTWVYSHYHRRWTFSLLSSKWDQVGPVRYHHQKFCRLSPCPFRSSKYFYASLLLFQAYYSHNLSSVSAHLSVSTIQVLYNQALRSISTGPLHTSLHFHSQPINVVVFNKPLRPYGRDISSRGWLPA